MSDAVVAFMGVALGALVSGLVALLVARQNNAQQAKLAAEEQNERRRQELRDQRRQVYDDFALLATKIRVAAKSESFTAPFGSGDELRDLSSRLEVYASDSMRDTAVQFGQVMDEWTEGKRTNHDLIMLTTHVLQQIRHEFAGRDGHWIADLSRTEAPE